MVLAPGRDTRYEITSRSWFPTTNKPEPGVEHNAIKSSLGRKRRDRLSRLGRSVPGNWNNRLAAELMEITRPPGSMTIAGSVDPSSSRLVEGDRLAFCIPVRLGTRSNNRVTSQVVNPRAAIRIPTARADDSIRTIQSYRVSWRRSSAASSVISRISAK